MLNAIQSKRDFPHGAYLLLGFSIIAFWIPVLVGLARHEWSTDQGAHGPLILATGLWLLFRETREHRHLTARGGKWLLFIPAALGLCLYLLGSRSGIVWIQATGALFTSLAIFFAYFGAVLAKKIWFPILYLFFVIPPPITMTGPVIRALKLGISHAAVDILSPLGFDVANSGTSIFIDQYEVTVAAACAGLNSLVSLQAIGLLYIYLFRRSDWKYSALLALLIFPIAVFANFVRVMLLLLATHYYGEAFAQGAFHEAAGLTMFMVTLAGLVVFDHIFAPLYHRLSGQASNHG